MNIDDILKDLVERRGSDLHIKVGRPPLMRISNDLLPTEYPAVTSEDVGAVLKKLIGADGIKKLQRDFEYDGSYKIEDLARFRINVFRVQDRHGIHTQPCASACTRVPNRRLHCSRSPKPNGAAAPSRSPRYHTSAATMASPVAWATTRTRTEFSSAGCRP